mmetsp:Transcript_25489/g.33300  ORF Transcript_25489/g.33300 Transcript_25489/m.33300 type:complete len:438 (-) Transcript_25489:439-1752(-)
MVSILNVNGIMCPWKYFSSFLSSLIPFLLLVLAAKVQSKPSIYQELDKNENIIKVQGFAQLEDMIEDQPFVVVFYYSSTGCENCDNAFPWFIKAAQDLSDHQPPIIFAALDSQDSVNDDDLAKAMAVRSWFSIRIYQGNTRDYLPYKGPKYRDGMSEELKAIRMGIEPEDSGVIKLTADNFYEVVNAHDFVMVKFYAPWCGHCKKMASNYTEVASELKDAKCCKLAEIDVTEEENFPIRDRYGFKAIPTVELFTGSEHDHIPYGGDRTKVDIIDFIYKEAGIQVPGEKISEIERTGLHEGVVTLSNDNFTNFVNSYDMVMVKFYAPWCGHCKDMAAAYEQLAASLENKHIRFAEVDCTIKESMSIVLRYSIRSFPTIKLFKGNDMNDVDYRGDRSEEDMLQFIIGQAQTVPGSAKPEIKPQSTEIAPDGTLIDSYYI